MLNLAPNDYGTLASLASSPNGAAFVVADVTDDVQMFADGLAQNLGWALISSNRQFFSSENADDGARPALFLDFEPADVAVPEPTSIAIWTTIAMLFFCYGLLRRQRCKARPSPRGT